MRQEGLVSVIIPVYGGENTLRTAIDSVLAQSYPSIEIVAVNDGSKDTSPQILDSYGDRIVAVHQENAGVAKARNAGISKATGEYIAFLDQDDAWREDKIQRQMELFAEGAGEVGLVHTLVQYFDVATGEHLPLLNPNAGTHLLEGDCKERLLCGNGIFNSSVMVRRAVLDKVGVCSTEISGNTVQDYDLWLRVAGECEFRCVKDEVTLLGIHPKQGLWNRSLMLTEEVKVLLSNLTRKEWKAWPQGRVRLMKLYNELGVAHLDEGDPALARHAFWSSIWIKATKRNISLFLATFLGQKMIDAIRSSR